ncbi:MAG: TIR domain-containing protein [Sulfurimonas sp.]|jgi:hypothetical protein
MAYTYTIFISHSWDNDKHHKDLKKLLNDKGYFNVEFEEATKDEPINSINALYIKQALKKRIENSNIILALAGVYASHSEWMQWELDKALELGVPIVGVAPWGQERVSQVVSIRAKEVVRWNTDPIVNAIRKHAKK